jgi:hypothetical protein
VHSVSGNSPSYFEERGSILWEHVSVTKSEKRLKNTIVCMVFSETREKSGLLRIVTAKLLQKTIKNRCLLQCARNSHELALKKGEI